MNQLYLENVSSAKESLKIWFSNLEQMNKGNQMFSREIEIDRKKTDFAKWYYAEGQTFSSFETFRNIESYYNKMYDLYLEYNYLYSKPVKKSFFSNQIEKRKHALNVLFKKIEFSSKELIKHITAFQNTLIESPLFANAEQTKELLQAAETEFEGATKEEQINVQVEENVLENNRENLVQLDNETTIEEQIPITEDNPVQDESDLNKSIEIDKKDQETEQTKEKKAILDISNKETDKKPPTEESTILPEIDIEEEIRRILN